MTVLIERSSDNDQPGATTVDSIRLTNASGVTGNLAELRITGNLGTPAVASEVTAITGVASVGGNLVREFKTGGLSGSFTASAIDKTIEVTGTHTGAITAATVTQTGNIWLSGAGTHTGSITIGGECRGSLLAGSSGTTATVSGPWTIHGDLTGNIRICGTMNGIIEIRGDVAQDDGVNPRSIYVKNVLNAPIRIFGGLMADNDWEFESQFCDSVNAADEIAVGSLGSAAAIVVDWNGHDPADDWFASATIRGAIG